MPKIVKSGTAVLKIWGKIMVPLSNGLAFIANIDNFLLGPLSCIWEWLTLKNLFPYDIVVHLIAVCQTMFIVTRKCVNKYRWKKNVLDNKFQ